MEYVEFKASVEPLEVGRDILIAELSDIGLKVLLKLKMG